LSSTTKTGPEELGLITTILGAVSQGVKAVKQVKAGATSNESRPWREGRRDSLRRPEPLLCRLYLISYALNLAYKMTGSVAGWSASNRGRPVQEFIAEALRDHLRSRQRG